MKTLHKILLTSAMLSLPLAAAHARSDQARHEAWIKAQKIDIKPTLKITETEIPAGTSATSTRPGTAGQPGSSMPPSAAPSQPSSPNMPSSGATPSSGYSPTTPGMGGQAPIETHPGVNPGTGLRPQ